MTLSLATPRLFVGIDVAKNSHWAGLLSRPLLAKHQRFDRCPALKFAQSRAGIDELLKAIKAHAPLSQTAVLLEQTGHYHRALVETLQAEGLQVYVIAIHRKKANGLDKTDRQDALRLANMLYNQVGLGQQVEDSSQRIERRLPPVPVAAVLAPLVRRRYELTQQETRLRNQLTAIADELFPELTEILSDVNCPVAIELRTRFPTAAAVASAEFAALREIKRGHHPTDKRLQELQKLAQHSIGVTEEYRVRGLVLEQSQLLSSLNTVRKFLAAIDARIREELAGSREGQILLSLPAIGPHHAAVLLSAIGNIRNFEKASHLRRFCGWAPQSFQTGISLDRDIQTRTGSRLIKREIYLICMEALQREPWKSFYVRLVEKKCPFDPRLQRYRSKMKVIGRLGGTIITMIYAFLKEDAKVMDSTPEGETPPPPMLYDPATHLAHRAGARIHPHAIPEIA